MSHSKEKESNNKTTKTKQWYAKKHGYPCTSEHGNNNGHRFTNKHGWTNEHEFVNRQWIWQDVNYQYVDAQEDLSKRHRFTANIEKGSAIALLAISMILAYIWHYTHSSLYIYHESNNSFGSFLRRQDWIFSERVQSKSIWKIAWPHLLEILLDNC